MGQKCQCCDSGDAGSTEDVVGVDWGGTEGFGAGPEHWRKEEGNMALSRAGYGGTEQSMLKAAGHSQLGIRLRL